MNESSSQPKPPALPPKWDWGIGEASRPLCTGGYYSHRAYRVVWKNQHAEQFYEAIIDTVDAPPEKHVLRIDLRTENESAGEITTDDAFVKRYVVDVDDPSSEQSQHAAEREIHQKAVELMREIELEL